MTEEEKRLKHNAASRRYYAAHRKKCLATSRKSHRKHAERRRAQRRKRYARDPEKFRARDRAYYAANREKERKRHGRYRAEHRNEILQRRRAAYAANPEPQREQARGRYRKLIGRVAEAERIVAAKAAKPKHMGTPGRPSKAELYKSARRLNDAGVNWPQCAEKLIPEEAKENRHAAAEKLRVGVARLKRKEKELPVQNSA